MKKIIKWILFIFWLLLIFIFSNQPQSAKHTHDIIGNLIPYIKTSNLLDIINYIIRKSAHFTEYFILCLLTISLLKEYTKKEIIIIISSLIFCFLYACSDEFHQSFIKGRTSQFSDVLIDTSGSIIYSIIYIIIIKIKKIPKS